VKSCNFEGLCSLTHGKIRCRRFVRTENPKT